MKYASIILCHYSKVDDFGGLRGDKSPNRSVMLKQSIESLAENTDYPTEIIVMDNGGNPDDTDYLIQKVRDGVINTLVRYKDNMHFAYAWNQGFRLATGDYLCFTCNDILFHRGWLTKTIQGLENYPDRKLIASPYITPDKRAPRWNKEILEDGYRINSMAGSNCFVTTRDIYLDIGEMPHHRIGGSIWYRVMVRKGYQVIVPPEDMVEHLAFRGGVNYLKTIEVNKTLLKGQVINFNYICPPKKIFNGKQNPAGISLIK